MEAPLIVPLADMAGNIGKFVTGALAVIGAGALGYFLTIAGIWLTGKFAFNKQPPKQASRVLGIFGGVLLAIAVAGFFFRDGGSGWGFGGAGFGLGKGSGTGENDGKEPAPVRTGPQPPIKTIPESPGDGSAAPLRVLMLGGARVPDPSSGRYYQVQPEGNIQTLDEVKQVIRKRAGETPPVKGVVIIITEDSVAQGHEAVKKLDEFARDEKLTVTYQLPPKRE